MSKKEPEASAVRSRFSVPRRVSLDTGSVGGADQSFKEECDINNIMRRYAVTGVLVEPGVQVTRVGRFEDLVATSPYEDFFAMQLKVREAEEAFETLPAVVRERFGNDVAALMAYLSEPKNREEAVKLGLMKPSAEPPAVPSAPPGAPQ